MALVKAKEKEMKDEKEAERKVRLAISFMGEVFRLIISDRRF